MQSLTVVLWKYSSSKIRLKVICMHLVWDVLRVAQDIIERERLHVEKSICPKIEPWGMPQDSGTGIDLSGPTTREKCLLASQPATQIRLKSNKGAQSDLTWWPRPASGPECYCYNVCIYIFFFFCWDNVVELKPITLFMPFCLLYRRLSKELILLFFEHCFED